MVEKRAFRTLVVLFVLCFSAGFSFNFLNGDERSDARLAAYDAGKAITDQLKLALLGPESLPEIRSEVFPAPPAALPALYMSSFLAEFRERPRQAPVQAGMLPQPEFRASDLPSSGDKIAPTGLMASPDSSGAVHLSWIDNSKGESAFVVERGSGAGWRRVARVASNGTFARVPGGEPGARLVFRVRAVFPDGSTAAAVPQAVETMRQPRPTSPEALWAEASSDGQITLQWRPGAGEVSSYSVERRKPTSQRWTLLGSLLAEETSFVDTDVKAGESYLYRVTANSPGGKAASRPIQIQAPPSAPVLPPLSQEAKDQGSVESEAELSVPLP